MNEMEVKTNAPKPICSLSGRPCRCAIGKGCGRGVVDPLADEALLAARTAHAHLAGALGELEGAIERLTRERPYPGPEWRDIGRRLEQLLDELQRTLS